MTIPSWAKPGAKVVCVDDIPDKGWHPDLGGLSVGSVYTIREIARHSSGALGVRLVEIVRRLAPADPWEQPFAFRRFRPLVSTKTEAEDVALFRHHLKQPEGV